MLALAAPLASAAPLRFPYNFLLPPHSPVIPAHLKFPYRFCPPTRPAPASAQPSFCAGFAAQKLLIRFLPCIPVWSRSSPTTCFHGHRAVAEAVVLIIHPAVAVGRDARIRADCYPP